MLRGSLNIHRDVQLKTVANQIRIAANLEKRLHQRENFDVIQLFDNSTFVRRLQRMSLCDLISVR